MVLGCQVACADLDSIVARTAKVGKTRSCLHVLFYFLGAGFQNIGLDTKLTAKNATDASKLQIRRLGDPDPMDDAPDQDSAKIQEKKFKIRILPTRAILGIRV